VTKLLFRFVEVAIGFDKIAKQNLARADWGPVSGQRRDFLFAPGPPALADFALVQRSA
jgi:hypothetical protein